MTRASRPFLLGPSGGEKIQQHYTVKIRGIATAMSTTFQIYSDDENKENIHPSLRGVSCEVVGKKKGLRILSEKESARRSAAPSANAVDKSNVKKPLSLSGSRDASTSIDAASHRARPSLRSVQSNMAMLRI